MERPGLPRRLAALTYDALLLFAVLYLATALVLPFMNDHRVPANTPWFTAYLLAVSFVFCGWFWTHGGQTLGMRAWRLRLRRQDGGPLTWADAAARFAAAFVSWLPAGAGFLWLLVDRNRLAWHDRLTRTELVLLPRN